ncbi:MAG: hypothetical protein Tsb0015_15730 [Simkaniaceae bacterium]
MASTIPSILPQRLNAEERINHFKQFEQPFICRAKDADTLFFTFQNENKIISFPLNDEIRNFAGGKFGDVKVVSYDNMTCHHVLMSKLMKSASEHAKSLKDFSCPKDVQIVDLK